MTRVMFRKLLILTACFGVFCGNLTFADVSDAELDAQRTLFKQVYKQLQTPQSDGAVITLPESLRTYVLYPWLEYLVLDKQFNAASDADLINFALKNPGSLLSDRISKRLAARWATQGEWAKILTIPSEVDDTDTQCLRVQALVASNKQAEALAMAKPLWMSIDTNMSDACVPVTTLLRNAKQLSADDYWQRISVAIERNQLTLANQLQADLPPDQQALATLRATIRRAPSDGLTQALKFPDSAYLRDNIIYALEKIANKNVANAEKLWANLNSNFKFTPAEMGRLESALGVQAALDHDTSAVTRLAAIAPENRSQAGQLWLARMAARTSNWPILLKTVDTLKFDNNRDALSWRYWKARALEQTGDNKAANTLYNEVAQQPSFYGFLAADRLGQAYASLQRAPVDRSQRVNALLKVAALQRAFEWLALGEKDQGRKEWFRTLTRMDKEGMIATAELALKMGNANLAIWTLSKAKEWDEVRLRFPLIYTDVVAEQANANGLTPAWVMGVMRRESAFDAKAESSAKALGLMQLIMPTARHVGNKLGITIKTPEDVLQPATNIQLGSAYLKELLNTFKGNYAQATAAYNAGPGRPIQWAPTTRIEADQWIESIPFTETREYVLTVMAYTTIYDYKLHANDSRRLTERLPPITPNAPPAATTTSTPIASQ